MPVSAAVVSLLLNAVLTALEIFYSERKMPL
jgi:hypothetical protein